jgi:hypothetical protein
MKVGVRFSVFKTDWLRVSAALNSLAKNPPVVEQHKTHSDLYAIDYASPKDPETLYRVAQARNVMYLEKYDIEPAPP